MAPRRSSNGRSPLVNQQRQITAFFAKKTTSTHSPSPSPSSLPPKPNPTFKNTSPNPNPSSISIPCSSPITTSPIDSKLNKPLLVIEPTEPSYRQEVLNRRIRVYWPLDKCWYEGCVKSFDKVTGKHLVQYDDSEEEMLDLCKEMIEWIETPVETKFRRLRRLKVVKDEEEEKLDGFDTCGDDSDDEDWGDNAVGEAEEDEGCLDDMDLEAEEEDIDYGVIKKAQLRKRKCSEGIKLASTSVKKIRSGGNYKSTKTKAPTGITGVKGIEQITNNLDCK